MKHTMLPVKSLSGEITVPASKSHTIRALLIAAMAKGESTIINPLDSADTQSCLNAIKVLGAKIELENDRWIIWGTGGDIHPIADTIDVGNSGTTLYLTAGLAALSSHKITFTGDDQIQSRPVENLLNSLKDLGAEISIEGKNGCPPFSIKGPLTGGKTSIECPTSQYLSSLLLCTPLINGNTEIEVPLLREQPYVEMTLKWLNEQFIMYDTADFKEFFIPGGQQFEAFDKQVPGDFSSATFFMCAAAITGSTLTLKGLDMIDSQGDKAVVYMLKEMGCNIEIGRDFVKIAGAPLKGCEFDLNDTPDALPALAVTACFAEGETKLFNVPQARLKETDRISVMKKELKKMGANIKELDDGLVIQGSRANMLKGTEVSGHKDHRVIMALAIAALAATGETTIDDISAVSITFPNFFKLLSTIVEY
ncbi:MAG: 3-phosphoshikimate 1-carboxyvinyltransferase [Spirochaetaceae bacterium]|nr:3-phosphoshikimate 1-carboxyvinyltransferase [Spirochaetaceae bacterium]